MNNTLISLNLSKNELSVVSIKDLAEALQESVVEELNLNQNPVADTGMEHLCTYLKAKTCQLKNLNLAECKLTCVGANKLFNALRYCG